MLLSFSKASGRKILFRQTHENGMNKTELIKEDLKLFYREETLERNAPAWLEAGNNSRVPESRASHYFIDRKVEEALALAGVSREAKVLEVGCSFGHMTFLLAQKFREVVAVDLSPESLELAEKRAKHYGISNLSFVCADAENLSRFEDDTFDAVFSFSTLRFCPDPLIALQEMLRVVMPRGRVVADFPNKFCPWFVPLKRMLGIKSHIHDHL
jgi:SAM-dependent methyltransferase